MPSNNETAKSRRDFLKLAGTAAPAAVAAVAVSGSEADASPAPVNEDRMQDTAHTRAYFDSARF